MTYKEFTTKSLQEFKELAEEASKLGCLDQFLDNAWDAIAIERGDHSADTMTKVVNNLEEYKRHLGRRYAATHDTDIKDRYNDLEKLIRSLTWTYEAKRITKPYYLR